MTCKREGRDSYVVTPCFFICVSSPRQLDQTETQSPPSLSTASATASVASSQNETSSHVQNELPSPTSEASSIASSQKQPSQTEDQHLQPLLTDAAAASHSKMNLCHSQQLHHQQQH
mmetsp:Transcript_25690/g.34080  ORF Transcript_25690/g.34080 Transcript_25690/m.34080 type:complete len:117 (+) Transcript_25690:73-423(+)